MYVSCKIVDAMKCGVPLSREFWLQFDMALGAMIYSSQECIRPPLTQIAEEVKRIAKVVPSVNCVIYSSEDNVYIRLVMDAEDIHKPLPESLYAIELTPEGTENIELIVSEARSLLFPEKPLKTELPKFFQTKKEDAIAIKP